jgi:hypothetical protein
MQRSVVGLTVFGVLVAGCYSLEPATSPTPELGKVVAFDLNDAGRLALGGSMGPEIEQIEGRLVERDSDYVLAVSGVRFLRGGEQAWRGERVHIKPAYVSSSYERRFSAGRSTVLGAIGAGVIAMLVSRSIIGGGSQDPVLPTDTSHTQRIPRP